MARVGTTIDPVFVPIAAATLGIRNASTSGVIRAALALFHGQSTDEAVKHAMPENQRFKANDGPSTVFAQVPDELAENCGDNKSYAVRVGLGIAMGMTREQAERWAQVKIGRPKKETADA